jgi:hypothetical protein
MEDPHRFATPGDGLDLELVVGGVSKSDLLRELAEQSVSLNEYARVLFDDPKFTTSPEPYSVRLVSVSLADIGLPDGGLWGDIVDRAASAGLRPCPLEVAPHLRLAYQDQPVGPYLTVVSLRLRSDDEYPNGLYLRRLEEGLWLRGYNSGPENLWPRDFSDFVFAME